ncbi:MULTISPECIES: oxidoreductase [Streptomyces]|uniref:Oxidoreductase n=1 Tax=Streptomyces flaveolus TaxID=67297 RepID=A0ABV3APV8_9ACTN|nr:MULTISPECIES: oxidoreductase [Streptomyces]KMS89901.1 short-chain dehydrogenase [Streptomyces regensis]KOG73991.1 short-chain dehydrogenase [Streptomyces antibioticus]
MSVWFVTGASRGLGRAIVEAAVTAGDQVVAAVRTPDSVADLPSDQVLVVPLDVRDEGMAAAAVEAAVERFGRIDVLVNNAGYGLLGPVEETSDKEARDLFDVNFFGLLNVTRQVLPVLRRQRSGRVINISSVGGFTALPGSGVYAATKFAVEAVTESLAAELAGSGVTVHVVEPGAFRTEFLDESSIRVTAAEPITAYEATVHSGRPAFLAASGSQPGDPAKAAQAVLTLAGAEEPPLRLQLGADSVNRVQAKLDLVRRELDTWRELSLSTAYDD